MDEARQPIGFGVVVCGYWQALTASNARELTEGTYILRAEKVSDCIKGAPVFQDYLKDLEVKD